MIILETVGEEDADHVLDLLLRHEVQLELVEEEIGDEFEHLGALVISSKSGRTEIINQLKRGYDKLWKS